MDELKYELKKKKIDATNPEYFHYAYANSYNVPNIKKNINLRDLLYLDYIFVYFNRL